MVWAPRTLPVAGQRSAGRGCSPQISHPTGHLGQHSSLCSQEPGGLGPPPCPARGKELSPQESAGNTEVKTGMGPQPANRAARRAGAWGGHVAGQRRPGLHTRWPAAGAVWAEAWGGRCHQAAGVPTAAPGLSNPTATTDSCLGSSCGGSSRGLKPLCVPITPIEAGRARSAQRAGVAELACPTSHAKEAGEEPVISSASQEGLRPDCSKAQGLDHTQN